MRPLPILQSPAAGGLIIATLIAIIASIVSGAAAASAEAQRQVAPFAAPLAYVEIIDRTTGAHLPLLGHAGERWVAGVPGHRYAIALRNQSAGRVLAVMAVDGVNVCTGETADWRQSGYVFAAGEGYQIAGWRKSTERVAAFEFAALPDSYAARTGRPDNVGVIGVALFREAAPPSVALQDRGAAARAAPEAAPPAAPSAESRLGTAHGRSEASAATYTDFERASAIPDEVIAIRYDRRENLIAMGVIAPPIAPTPNPVPFPASTGGFVPDPPSR